MIESNSLILSATLHEPQFRLKKMLLEVLPIIKTLFSASVVCCTPSTGSDVVEFLKNEGFSVPIGPVAPQYECYRLAHKIALTMIVNPALQKIFYIDFDRLIHWASKFPEELKDVLQNIDVDYLHIGRTDRAFESHPITQKNTEIIVNELGSKILGFEDVRDIISVCYTYTKELGEKLLSIENATNTGFYGTWPLYLYKWATSKQYLEVEGHEWETPDRFAEEISKDGYENWLNKFKTPVEWERRINLMHDCLQEMFEMIKIEIK